MFVIALLAVLLDPQTPAPEVLADVQVRGNVATTDADVRQMAGLEIGAPVAPDAVAVVTARLRAAKRFERVDVLKRYASLTDATRIVLVIIVDEGAVSIRKTNDPDHPIRVVRSRWPKLLFMPIFASDSGYGVTYGVRLTHPEPAGRDSRLSFPASWGGTKRIGAEFEKRYPDGWLTRIEAGGSASRRMNPFYDAQDDRNAVWFRAERQVTRALRVRGLTGWQGVTFREESDRVATVGAEVILDTRLDPFLARNAVFLRAERSRLTFRQRDAVNRTEVEAHGYLGLPGQAILVASGRRDTGDGPLPDYLKPLFGGPTSVRGFRTGTSSGDTLVSGSLELRLPLTSALSFGKVGVSGFVDAGAVYNDGERFADQALKRGAGGSVWFAAAFVRFSVAVAHGIGASTRVHVQGNLTF